MAKDTSLKEMQKEISSLKTKLIKRAAKKGLWENFGQAEVRYLTDKYHVFFRQDMAEELMAFDEWAMNYEPESGGAHE